MLTIRRYRARRIRERNIVVITRDTRRDFSGRRYLEHTKSRSHSILRHRMEVNAKLILRDLDDVTRVRGIGFPRLAEKSDDNHCPWFTFNGF